MHKVKCTKNKNIFDDFRCRVRRLPCAFTDEDSVQRAFGQHQVFLN